MRPEAQPLRKFSHRSCAKILTEFFFVSAIACMKGHLYKTVKFPVEIRPDAVKATLKNGILEVVLPKAELVKKGEDRSATAVASGFCYSVGPRGVRSSGDAPRAFLRKVQVIDLA